MASQYKVTRTEVAVRYFTCPRCGAKGEVEFHAVGEGGWVRESYWQEDAAGKSAEQAAADMILDADRVSELIRCPACELRAPGVFRSTAIKICTALGIATAAPVIDREWIWGTILFVFLAGWFAWRELRRVRRADRAVILKLEYGTEAVPKPKPLPAARALAKPKPAPPIVVPTVAPVIEQPRGPDEGPAFLKGED